MKVVAALLLITFLTACGFGPPVSPLPTPTTVTANLLPVEGLRQGWVCEELGGDPQLVVLKSEAEWNDLLSQFSLDETSFAIDGADAVILTDFRTQRLLLALRPCYSNSNYRLRIDRVVQVSNDRIFVYLELSDPAPGSYRMPPAEGYYYFASIPWSEENAEIPTVEIVAYTQLLMYGQPVE
ncbi:MAG: hypothetical protein IT328_10560 [Caldilineaceae bacterium]|nr:hypothetical protein [Caldilineaceae bacterium]